MQNARDLLNSFGSPPAEVCIDWAWQLLSMAQAGLLPLSFSWSDLRVSRNGQLSTIFESAQRNSIDPFDPIQTLSFQKCVLQLIGWSSNAERQLSAESISWSFDSLHSLLRELALQHRCLRTGIGVSSLRQSAEPVQESKVSTSETVVARFTSTASSTTTTEVAGSAIMDHSTLQIGSIQVTKSSAEKIKGTRWRLYAAVSVVLAAIPLAWWWIASADNTKSLAASTGTEKQKKSSAAKDASSNNQKNARPSNSTSSGRSKRSSKNSASEMDQLLGGSSAGVGDSDQIGSLSTPSTSSVIDLNNPLSQGSHSTAEASKTSDLLDTKPSIEIAEARPLSDAESNSESTDRSAGAQNISSKAEDGSGSNSAVEKSASLSAADAQKLKLDVASETSQESVAKLLGSPTSSDAKVSTMTDSVDGAIQSPPPHLLNIEDLVQVQEIPNKVRVREATWELRISSTQSTDVEPAGIQTLTEKSPVRWIFSSRELKPRKNQDPTKVAVIAEIVNKRGDIRWTIVAGTQDLPNLRFPMNQERLDQLLNTLQNYQQRLTISIEQIKAAMELSDFPKELKSFWTAQRRTFENEVKLTTRARQVVADASMLTSWMDRTIEVHGRLLDTLGNKSEVVLEFGQAELKQKDAP